MTNFLIPLLSLLAASAQTPSEIQKRAVAAQQKAVEDAMRPSIERQAAAIRKQAKVPAIAAPAFFIISPPEPVREPVFDCESMPPMRSARLVQNASLSTGVSAELLTAVIQQESAFRPCAVSSAGAQGLMQLMPATIQQFGVTDPFDPEQNISAGAGLLKELMTRYSGDLNRVLGAYNAGPARVDAAGGIPFIPETMNYVDKILGSLNGPAR